MGQGEGRGCPPEADQPVADKSRLLLIFNLSFLLYLRNTTLRKQMDEAGSDEVGLAKQEQEDTPTVRSWGDSFILYFLLEYS